MLLIFISLNFLSNVRPFPFGFDALATYLNLPNLISEQHGIIESYSPYYWSLFVSLGHIIFDKTEIVIALSIGGGILSLFVIFEICRKWLDLNFSLLTVLIFYSLPFVNYQSFRDIKTDLGLLFFLLVTVLVLIKWLSLIDDNAFQKKVETSIKNKKKRLKSKQRKTEVLLEDNNKEKIKQGWLGSFFTEDTQLVIILGILSGFSIGIKLIGTDNDFCCFKCILFH